MNVYDQWSTQNNAILSITVVGGNLIGMRLSNANQKSRSRLKVLHSRFNDECVDMYVLGRQLDSDGDEIKGMAMCLKAYKTAGEIAKLMDKIVHEGDAVHPTN